MFSTFSKVWNDVSEEAKKGQKKPENITNRTEFQDNKFPDQISNSKVKSTRFSEEVDVRYKAPSRWNRHSSSRNISTGRYAVQNKERDASLSQSRTNPIPPSPPPILKDRSANVTSFFPAEKKSQQKSEPWSFFGTISNLFSSTRELDEMKNYMNNMIPSSSSSGRKHKLYTDVDEPGISQISSKIDNYSSSLGTASKGSTNPLLSMEPRPWKRRKLDSTLDNRTTATIDPLISHLPDIPVPLSSSRRLHLKTMPEYRLPQKINTFSTATTSEIPGTLSKNDITLPSLRTDYTGKSDLITSSPKKVQSNENELETFRLMYQKLHDKVNKLIDELQTTKMNNDLQKYRLTNDFQSLKAENNIKTQNLEQKLSSLERKHQSEIMSLKNIIRDFITKQKEAPSIIPNLSSLSPQKSSNMSLNQTPPRSTRPRTSVYKSDLQVKEKQNAQSGKSKDIPVEEEENEKEKEEEEFDISLSPAKTDISQYLSKIL